MSMMPVYEVAWQTLTPLTSTVQTTGAVQRAADFTFAGNKEWLNAYYAKQGYEGSQKHLFTVQDKMYGSCVVMCDYGAELAMECGIESVCGLSSLDAETRLTSGETSEKYLSKLRHDLDPSAPEPVAAIPVGNPAASAIQSKQCSLAELVFAKNVKWLNAYYAKQGYDGSQKHLFNVPDKLYGSCVVMCDYGAELAMERGIESVRGLSGLGAEVKLISGETVEQYISKLRHDLKSSVPVSDAAKQVDDKATSAVRSKRSSPAELAFAKNVKRQNAYNAKHGAELTRKFTVRNLRSLSRERANDERVDNAKKRWRVKV